MNTSPYPRNLKWLASCHSASFIMPLIWFPVLALYAYRAQLILHRWPSYDMPDPKDLHLYIFHSLVGASITISMFSILAWPLLTLLVLKLNPQRSLRPLIIVFCFVVTISVLGFVFDPTGFVEWYFD